MGTLSQKKPSSRLYEIPPTTKRLFVVGDLHGDRISYDTVVNSWRSEKDSSIIFLGDYADRGPHGLEVIEALMKLSKEDGVVVLKGNHEDYFDSGQPDFSPCHLISEVTEKRGSWDSYFSQCLKPFFDGLYISAVLPGKILFIHGGISTRIENIDSLMYPTPETERDRGRERRLSALCPKAMQGNKLPKLCGTPFSTKGVARRHYHALR